MRLTRFATALFLLLVASLSWGWHEDKPVGAAFQPEVTDQRLVQDQSCQKTLGIVGQVPEKQDDSAPIDPEMSDTQSEQAVAQVENDQAVARQVLKDASHDAYRAEFAPRALISGGIVLAVVLGVFFALRQWANRNIPEPFAVQRLKW